MQQPGPDVNQNIGSSTRAEQTGGVMIAYERVSSEHRPDRIVVVRDVNSTAACAMVGAKLWIPVIHLEAGLRSDDRRMREEINRPVSDAIADAFWTPPKEADENLHTEGVEPKRIDRIGNFIIDSFEMLRSSIDAADTRAEPGVEAGEYAMVTLHCPNSSDGAPQRIRE